MITLENDNLVFRFPEVHEDAILTVHLQRTLRIPDDDNTYPLPPGLGRFPLRHVDDFAANVPERWLEHGGTIFPMYQSEAMWLCFSSGGWLSGGSYGGDRDGGPYPFAIKVAAGKINAVTGEPWSDGIGRSPQNYMVSPTQPWLDGYCVEKGVIRQFVAMPLGAGYSAEEQITGEAEHGGLQIIAYPMKADAYERLMRKRDRIRGMEEFVTMDFCLSESPAAMLDMGLAPGGRMKQEIYDDPYKLKDWDIKHSSRCFVHIANSLVWRQITGEAPPTVPPTAKEYKNAGLPWFDYYSDAKALKGSKTLAKLKSVATLGKKKGEVPLPENETVVPDHIIELRRGLAKNQVREW
jgi:hypothetical protein